MSKYANKSDCEIIRPPDSDQWGEQCKGKTLLVGKESDVLFKFYGDWTDEQIWHSLNFVNAKFDHGIELGRHRAKTKMRKALGLDNYDNVSVSVTNPHPTLEHLPKALRTRKCAQP